MVLFCSLMYANFTFNAFTVAVNFSIFAVPLEVFARNLRTFFLSFIILRSRFSSMASSRANDSSRRVVRASFSPMESSSSSLLDESLLAYSSSSDGCVRLTRLRARVPFNFAARCARLIEVRGGGEGELAGVVATSPLALASCDIVGQGGGKKFLD